MIIQPKFLSLGSLLNNRLFKIPSYQRAYSWGIEQRKDLFNDIEKIHTSDGEQSHFMATIVCLVNKNIRLGTDIYDNLDVVDGQQRLTTLIILLKSIALALNDNANEEKDERQKLSALLVKPHSSELLLLQTNHDKTHHFANFMRTGNADKSSNAKTVADKEILLAIEDCNKFVQMWKESRSLIELVALIKNRLCFLYHEIADERTVYTVFEVLNSRGLDVSWFDRLKSILMGAALELKGVDNASVIKDLHNTWGDIYSVIGLRQGMSTESLRYTATLYATSAPKRTLSEKDAVDQLRQHSVTGEDIRKTANQLLGVVKAYDAVIANKRISAVARISQVRLLATAIGLRTDLTDPVRAGLMKAWEKVSFRIYGMLRHDARTRVGDYIRLAWRVINANINAKQIKAEINEIGKEFLIADAVKALASANCYNGWEEELRYFMFRYEEHLATKSDQKFRSEQWEKIWMASCSDSIEHIWPQSKAPESYMHRLGNLILLPPRLNSKLNNNDPSLKVDQYIKTGLLIAHEVAETINNQGWKKSAINEREKCLLEWALVEWGD